MSEMSAANNGFSQTSAKLYLKECASHHLKVNVCCILLTMNYVFGVLHLRLNCEQTVNCKRELQRLSFLRNVTLNHFVSTFCEGAFNVALMINKVVSY